jgi:hypothetical protein
MNQNQRSDMSKLGLLLLGIVVLPVIFLVACSSNNTNAVNASLGQDFTLPVGQTAYLASENMNIKFDTVTNDSRCPDGVQCIRAGEAVCRVSITQGNNSAPAVLTLTQPGLTSGPAQNIWSTNVGNTLRQYVIKFDLTPYPEAGQPVESSAYKLQLNITRSS